MQGHTVYGKTFKLGGKLSRLCTKHTIHWKIFTGHQVHAIMYCTQQMIQGENFHDWLKNRENCKSFAVYGNTYVFNCSDRLTSERTQSFLSKH